MGQVHPLSSSALISCEYNEQKRELFIIFTDGTAETYIDVPKSIYEELIAAKSAGSFFNSSIRPVYKFY